MTEFLCAFIMGFFLSYLSFYHHLYNIGEPAKTTEPDDLTM